MYEPCIYKKVSGSEVIFLILYVDNILLIGNDISLLQTIKIWLSKNLSIKDMKEAAYILKVKICKDRQNAKTDYHGRIWWCLSILYGIHLSKEMCPKTQIKKDRMERIPYASTIGSIMYAILYTRPNVSYALSITSWYQSNLD